MKHFIFILMIFSLNAFSNEVQSEDDCSFVKASENFSDVIKEGASTFAEDEKDFHNYLDKGCDLSVKELAPYSEPEEYTRAEHILYLISFSFHSRSHFSVLKRLLKLSDVNLNIVFNVNSYTPLALSIALLEYKSSSNEDIENLDLEFIKLLLENGADPNYQDSLGYTIFMRAILVTQNKSKKLYDLFIKHGADLDTLTDHSGFTGRGHLNSEPPEEFDRNWDERLKILGAFESNSGEN